MCESWVTDTFSMVHAIKSSGGTGRETADKPSEAEKGRAYTKNAKARRTIPRVIGDTPNRQQDFPEAIRQ
jgi:hypothetical protein